MKQDYKTTTGTRGGGWEHTRVGSRSLTAPRSACSLRAYIGSISGVLDVQSFGSLAMTISNSSLTITKKVVAFITFSHKNFKDTAYCARGLTK